jgi:hypothetical protein
MITRKTQSVDDIETLNTGSSVVIRELQLVMT